MSYQGEIYFVQSVGNATVLPINARLDVLMIQLLRFELCFLLHVIAVQTVIMLQLTYVTLLQCFNGFDEVCIGWDQVCDNYCHCFFLVEQCRDESATQCKLKRLRTGEYRKFGKFIKSYISRIFSISACCGSATLCFA